MQHIPTRSPLNRELVESYLDGIKPGDPEVRAAVAVVRQDQTPAGLMYNFEDAAAYIVPTCPVSKKKDRKASAQVATIDATIAAADAIVPNTTSNGVAMKHPSGKTGVYLGWIRKEEYALLTPEQHAERKAFSLTEAGRTLSEREFQARRKRKRGSGGNGNVQNLQF